MHARGKGLLVYIDTYHSIVNLHYIEKYLITIRMTFAVSSLFDLLILQTQHAESLVIQCEKVLRNVQTSSHWKAGDASAKENASLPPRKNHPHHPRHTQGWGSQPIISARPPSRTNSMLFLYIYIYIRSTVRRALNLLRASFSPIFQYFSAANVTRVFFLRYFNIS